MANPKTEFIVSAENRASKVLREVAKDFEGMGDASKSASSMLMGFGSAFVGLAGAAFSLRGVANEFQRIVGLQDSFGKLAQQTGVSVQALTELDYAASLSDVSTDELGGALVRLSSKMGDVAQGSSEAKDVFDSLGVKVKETDGTLRSSEEVLKDIAQRFSEFRDGSTKSAFATEIFGRAGAKLIPLLNQGRAGLAEMADEARAAGVVFDQDAARKAETFNDNLTKIGKTIDGLKLQAFGSLVESLGDVSTAFLSAQRASHDFWGSLLTGVRTLGRSGELESQLAEIDRTLEDKFKLRDTLRGNVFGRAGEAVFNAFSPDFLELDGQIRQLQRDRESVLRAIEQRINADMTALGGFDKPAPPKFNPTSTSSKGAKALDIFSADEKRVQSLTERAINDNAITKAEDYAAALERIDSLFWSGLLNVEAYDMAIQALSKSTTASGAEGETALDGLAEKWKDLIDPTREYGRQLEEIRKLVAAGKLTPDQGISAEFEVESKRNLNLFDDTAADDAKKASEAARELGLTFQSAFEDAIIEGKKFSEVLKGVGDDLLRLTLRKTVTEKAANWLSTTLDLGSLFGGPKLASGIDFVPYDNYPALLHRGERVVPAIEASKGGRGAGVNITNHYTFGSGVNVAQLTHYAERIKQDTVATVFDRIRRANYSGDHGVMGF